VKSWKRPSFGPTTHLVEPGKLPECGAIRSWRARRDIRWLEPNERLCRRCAARDAAERSAQLRLRQRIELTRAASPPPQVAMPPTKTVEIWVCSRCETQQQVEIGYRAEVKLPAICPEGWTDLLEVGVSNHLLCPKCSAAFRRFIDGGSR
jgi:hypothetical protein